MEEAEDTETQVMSQRHERATSVRAISHWMVRGVHVSARRNVDLHGYLRRRIGGQKISSKEQRALGKFYAIMVLLKEDFHAVE
jgi:hypothetical protein